MQTTSTIALKEGREVFTLVELFSKAATYKGIEFLGGLSYALSKPIAACTLDENRLKFLASRKIEQQDRTDIFGLVDNNRQKPRPGFCASDYWNFSNEQPRQVTLSLGFNIGEKERGVFVFPHTMATGASAADHLPQFRLFKALVESGGEFPQVAHKIAESNGHIIVTWTDLGIAGLRSLSKLFEEFSQGRDEIEELARMRDMFIPQPHGERHSSSAKEKYAIESVQPRIMKGWSEQLEAYCLRLTL
jgi:hypothetical protein